MTVNNTAQLSIIIVSHRSEDILDECLKSILASETSLSFEIIIVNNPPGPKTNAESTVINIPVKHVDTKRRLGFGEACNYGALSAAGKFLLFLNPDVQVHKSALERLYKALTNTPDAGLVTGRLTDLRGNFQPSCRRFPTLKNLFFSRGSLLSRLGDRSDPSYTLPDYPGQTRVDASAAAMMMISKDHFDRLGGFDESFFIYMEDTDLCRRISEMGLSAIYVPEAQGIHLWGHSTGRYRFRRIIWHHRSVWRYFVKHHRSISVLIPLCPLLIINCFLSLIVELFTLRS